MIRKRGEKSFSLFETIVALSLIVTVVLQMSSVQGNSISLSLYSRQMNKALWLAQSILAKLEYSSKFYPLKEMKLKIKEERFSSFLCSKDEQCPFKYNITTKKWDLPLIELILGGKSPLSSGGEESQPDPMAEMIKSQVKQYFDGELLNVALVEVYWSEGARKNSIEMPYLLTNQLTLDNIIETQELSEKAIGKTPASIMRDVDATGNEKRETKGKID